MSAAEISQIENVSVSAVSALLRQAQCEVFRICVDGEVIYGGFECRRMIEESPDLANGLDDFGVMRNWKGDAK